MSDVEQQDNTPSQDSGSVETAAAKIAQIKAGNEPEPEVELPEPELAPMTDEETETLVQRDQRLQLENYRLQLANEQARLQEQLEDIKYLRDSDPGEYAARLFEHNAQEANFNAALQQYQAAATEIQDEDLKKQQQHMLNEQEMLKQKIPDWNQTKADKLTKYLLRQGYSREQINSVTDHKILVAFYQQMTRKKVIPESAKKKITKSQLNRHNDPALLADLERRNESKHTVKGAAERILAIMGG